MVNAARPSPVEKQRKVLLIGADDRVQLDLRERGFRVDACASVDEAQAYLAHGADALLADLRLGLDFIGELVARVATVPLVVMGAESLVECRRLGAYDVVANSNSLEQLAWAIERAAAHHTALNELEQQRLRNQQQPEDESEFAPLAEIERRYILQVLHALRGNKRRAAEVLGLDRSTLYRKLEAYGVLSE